MPYDKFIFGAAPDGRAVSGYRLTNAQGTRATLCDLGATLVALELPDASAPGAVIDVVLGFDSAEAYWTNAPYFGATVGRYANRVAAGQFSLDGTPYTLAVNDGRNHLHGGPTGFHRRLWQVEPAEQVAHLARVRFDLVSPDGDEGYPGELRVSVSYELTADNRLIIDYVARTDRATVVNLTHHSYFNLTGKPEAGIGGHVLRIAADTFTPTDANQIPTGELKSVADSPFDFREPTPIGARIAADDPDLRAGSGYDHNFVVQGWDGSLKRVAEVHEPKSGRSLVVSTTEPGLQFYSGNYLAGVRGKGGRVHAAREGFCLEAQHFPDSPNQPSFPTTVLRPGETYRQTTEYAFHAPA
ncbi:MAG TPA: aldose epimerase family protein [Polyangiaceae bacterium]|nr:aldose epimerase family protein [Polyangiaceae bacterium]